MTTCAPKIIAYAIDVDPTTLGTVIRMANAAANMAAFASLAAKSVADALAAYAETADADAVPGADSIHDYANAARAAAEEANKYAMVAYDKIEEDEDCIDNLTLAKMLQDVAAATTAAAAQAYLACDHEWYAREQNVATLSTPCVDQELLDNTQDAIDDARRAASDAARAAWDLVH